MKSQPSISIASLDMQSFLLIITIVSAFACSAASAFSFSPHRKQNGVATNTRIIPFDNHHHDNSNKQLPEPNFHMVAQKIGKTVLRPGGSDATELVQSKANITPGTTVLELAAGLGKSGIELAQRYGAKVTITDMDVSRLEKARDCVARLGLGDLVDCRQVEMFDVACECGGLGPDAKFDVAQTEASLTHYPRSRKAHFFKGIAKHTNKFILHEVCFKQNTSNESQELVKKKMSKVLNIGFIPETSETWQQLLIDAGFGNIEFVATGDLALLDPISLIKDEGVVGFVNILYNVVTQPYLRSRMLAVRGTISRHSGELGYVTIVASKENN